MSLFGSVLARNDCEEDRSEDSWEKGKRPRKCVHEGQDATVFCPRQSAQPMQGDVRHGAEEQEDQGKGKRCDKEGAGKAEEKPSVIGSLIGMNGDAEIHGWSVACTGIWRCSWGVF